MTRQPDWVGHLDVKRAIRGLIDRPRIASFPEASDNLALMSRVGHCPPSDRLFQVGVQKTSALPLNVHGPPKPRSYQRSTQGV
jgi:hypothetical protein